MFQILHRKDQVLQARRIVVQLQDDRVHDAVEDHIHAAQQILVPQDKRFLLFGDPLQRLHHFLTGADK